MALPLEDAKTGWNGKRRVCAANERLGVLRDEPFGHASSELAHTRAVLPTWRAQPRWAATPPRPAVDRPRVNAHVVLQKLVYKEALHALNVMFFWRIVHRLTPGPSLHASARGPG